MLTISHLSKTYPGGKTAVRDLSFSVQPGEIFGFIGHNGAGKSTTLRAAAGILPFEAGQITIGGFDIQRQPVQAKSITAFLPDNPDLYEFLTGIRFLNFVADLYNIPSDLRTQRIAQYGDMFEMTSALGSAISSYSHGMKQKLALISALMRQPQLLILDEPFVGLDPKASHLLKQQLQQLCIQGGSVLFSTHVLEVAEKLCHRIGIIRQGQLVACGPTAELVGTSSLEEVFLELEGEGEGK
mgnify:FL=1